MLSSRTTRLVNNCCLKRRYSPRRRIPRFLPTVDRDGIETSLEEFDPILDHSLSNNNNTKGKDGHQLNHPMPAHLLSSPDDQVTGLPNSLLRRTLLVRRTVNMTRKGKVPSMSALVVVGNGLGAGGIGEGKGEELGVAVKKATERAAKAMTFIPRLQDRTIFHPLEVTYKACRIRLWPRPPGFGIRCNRHIHELCQCIGIQDISGKVLGSRNPLNVVKGALLALQTQQRLPEVIARGRGKRLVDVQSLFSSSSLKTKEK